MSYFGSAQINEGAAGLGDTTPARFMPPPVHATREGSLGEYFAGMGAADFYRPETRAFQEGSLGARERRPGRRRPTNWRRMSGAQRRAWRRRQREIRRAQRAASGLGATTFMRPSTRAYREGSLGEYFAANGLGATATFMRPSTRAYREGSLGEYFSGVGVIGTAAGPETLDLTNPGTLTEVKMLMAWNHPTGGALDEAGVQYWDEDWYVNGLWDEKANELWGMIDEAVAGTVPAEGFSIEVPGQEDIMYPGVPGILTLGGTMQAADPAFVESYPTTDMWLNEANTNLAGARVTEPNFTIEETIAGKKSGMMSMGNMAWLGAGAVAIVGAALVLGGGKKKK